MLLHFKLDKIMCEIDSLDVVTLLQNRTNHRLHDYVSVLFRLTALINSLLDLVLQHVPRETNERADFLAKFEN